jgi:hypothetical protein
MAFDGTYLWHSDKNTRTIYRLDYNNPTIVYESFVVSWEPRDLGWYGNHLWATANATTIYELDPSDMSVINSWPSGRSNTAGLALGGGYLWFGSNNSDRGMVYKVDVPLALHEVAFSAIACYPTIILEWTLTVQPEMTAFLIERRIAGDEYRVINTVPCACGAPVVKTFSIRDEAVQSGVTYHYRLSVITSYGEQIGLATASALFEEMPLMLHVAPNPFISKVKISLSGETGNRGIDEPEIKIYDITGRLVRKISLSPFSFLPGATVTWDGKNSGGEQVSPGTYYAKFAAGNRMVTEKIIRVK